MAFIIWELISTNILPQVGHHSELSSYAVYTVWRILSGRRINLPSLILSHIWRCRNQMRACLPYGRLLTSLFFQAKPNLEMRTTTILPTKTINYTNFCNKLIGRENKKRKMDEDATTSRGEPHQEQDDEWLDDAARMVEEENPPPPTHESVPPSMPSYEDWHELCSRVDSLSVSLDDIRRDQQVFYRHMSSHYGFPLADYSFSHPPTPDAPHDPTNGGDDAT